MARKKDFTTIMNKLGEIEKRLLLIESSIMEQKLDLNKKLNIYYLLQCVEILYTL